MWPVAGFGMDSISKLVINFEILAKPGRNANLASFLDPSFAGLGGESEKLQVFGKKINNQGYQRRVKNRFLSFCHQQ